MRKIMLCMLLLVGAVFTLEAQAPNAFNYQAAVRDASGAVLNNQSISLRFSILQTTSSGTSVYSETHAATTNDYGIVNVEIGNGTVVSGDFSSIDWSGDAYFIKTELDPAGGTAFTDMATQQLLSVPYALSSGSTKSLSDADGDTWINTETNPDEDFIRMSLQGIPSFLLDTGRVWVGTRRFSTSFGNFTSNKGVRNTNMGVFAGNLANDTAVGNTAIGYAALTRNKIASYNTALGFQSLYSNIGGTWNTALGVSAMAFTTTGSYNSSLGTSSLFRNDSGSRNVAIGVAALNDQVTGNQNVAVGADAMATKSAGSFNTAVGGNAMRRVDSISYSVAVGYSALHDSRGIENVTVGANSMLKNVNGNHNVVMGTASLRENIGGSLNTAIGHNTLAATDSSRGNIAIGHSAMSNTMDAHQNIAIGLNAMINAKSTRNIAVGSSVMSNLTANGVNNTAVGNWSLISLTSGDRNSAVGDAALNKLTTGNRNTAVGSGSLFNSTTARWNTAVGERSGITNVTGLNNTFVGFDADNVSNALSNTLILGSGARGSASNTTRIGNTIMTSIGGYQGWSNLSDGTFKNNVKEDVVGLDFIMKLRPVTYTLDVHKLSKHLREDEGLDEGTQVDPQIIEARNASSAEIRTGFIAQEVEKSAKELGFEFNGVDKPKNADDTYALRYAKFVAPLVKGMQEQQKLIEALQAEIEALKAKIK